MRPGDLFDAQLADADRFLFLGHDPAALLHDLWGVGAATELFSAVYMLFFLFIPVTLARRAGASCRTCGKDSSS